MNRARKFSLEMKPVSMPSGERLCNADLSEESENIIQSLYDTANQVYVSGMEYKTKKLENSLFFCCLTEGAVMLSFFPQTSGSMISMRGIFIPMSCLRTAWNLYLEELMYIVAEGGKINADIDYQMIYQLVSAAKKNIGEEYCKKIAEFYKGMKKDTPYNFAMTNFPKQNLCVDFKGGETGAGGIVPIQESESGKLVIKTETVRLAEQNLRQRDPELADMYIYRDTKKGYIDIKKDEYKSAGMKRSDIKARMEDIENELKNSSSENVWYVFLTDTKSAVLLSQPVIGKLEKEGCIDFAELCKDVRRRISDAKLRDAEMTSEESEETPKKRGFFLGRR